MYLICK